MRRRRPRLTGLANATRAGFLAAVNGSGLRLDPAQEAAAHAMADGAGRGGVYLWGDTGRGKTAMSTLYFDAIPTQAKRRFHFHEFFTAVDAFIASTRKPVDDAVEAIIGNAAAIMFDEFHVHDVADAIYLTATLRHIVRSRTLMVATSNYPPAELLPNPVMHHRFRPAIDLIERELQVIWIGDGHDYRTRGDRLGDAASQGFAAGTWSSSVSGRIARMAPGSIDLKGQSVAVRSADVSVAATFAQLCERPLGARQYLALTERFGDITLLDIPELAGVEQDPLRRFGNLIDICCDRDIELHVVSSGQPSDILRARQPPPDVTRTVSRLSMLRVVHNGHRGWAT